MIDDTCIFEIDEKKKNDKQIENIEKSFVVVDDQDYPVCKIPLWVLVMGGIEGQLITQ